MYDNLPWNDIELELIQLALAKQARLFGVRPLLEHRHETLEVYKSHSRNTDISKALDGIDPSHIGDLDQYGFDLLTVRNIRHRHTNYDQFWDKRSKSPLHDIIWLIGFLKVGTLMKSEFPELADAITFERIRRVSVQDRALLRETIMTLADHEYVGFPHVPLTELRITTANRYNKSRLPHEPTKSPMDASSSDEAMQDRIHERIVADYVDRNCGRALRKLGTYLLDDYYAFVVRARLCLRALGTLGEHYPELTDICQRRSDAYSMKLSGQMDIVVGKKRAKIYAPAIGSVLVRTVKTHNIEHHEAIAAGADSRLYLTGASQAVTTNVRAQAVRDLLSCSCRYNEFADIAASLPEPMASIQGNRLRRLFLERIQDRYPELTEAVQAELRLLAVRQVAAAS